MATLAIGNRITVGARKEKGNSWEKVRNIVASVAGALEPFTTAGRLDYLEPGSRARLSPRENAIIDADLNSIHTN